VRREIAEPHTGKIAATCIDVAGAFEAFDRAKGIDAHLGRSEQNIHRDSPTTTRKLNIRLL
jgi:hypothetical protein